MTIGYKVCRRNSDDPDIYSPIVVYSTGLDYQIGRKIKRRENWGPYAVFDNLQDAKNFEKWHGGFTYGVVTLECEYVESEGRSLYKMLRNNAVFASLDLCPKGTVLADYFVLLRQV
jgi:hypothetical protein